MYWALMPGAHTGPFLFRLGVVACVLNGCSSDGATPIESRSSPEAPAPRSSAPESSRVATTATTPAAAAGDEPIPQSTLPFIPESSAPTEEEDKADPCEDPRLSPAEYCYYNGGITVCEERLDGGICDGDDWFYRYSWLRSDLLRFSHDYIIVQDTLVVGFESSCCYHAYTRNAGR